MKFLESIAAKIMEDYDDPGKLMVVFPNRRAGLFLQSILRRHSSRPVWAPEIISFQDMVRKESSTYQADPLKLIYELYRIYCRHIPAAAAEGFERFYYWGKMLLKDFDEIDRYMVDGTLLYRNLAYQKELDLLFDFLTSEQKQLLRRFWQGFEDSRSEKKERFLAIWEKLGPVYTEYRQTLIDKRIAYEGLQYRLLAGSLEDHSWRQRPEHLLFAGFNALTRAEETIITWCIRNLKAEMIWDLDEYYVNDPRQEAGRFFREYKSKSAFAEGFPKDLPNDLKKGDKDLEIIGVPQYVGQARIAGQRIGELIRGNAGIDLRRIAVVLADESLLLPMLNALPPEATKVNVTMGFPLTYAPVNSLLEYLIELQVFRKERKGFHYSSVAGVLRHPLVVSVSGEQNPILLEMQRNNRAYLPEGEFGRDPLLQKIFRPAGADFLTYLLQIIDEILAYDGLDRMNRTFVDFYRKQLGRYFDILQEYQEHEITVETFKRLFRQLTGSEKVPFTGEPLEGIQIMGVLETRNLDFDHVYLLSCNEGSLPATGSQHSFLPHNIRRAYELPHSDQQDAIYAYLFYRLLQGARSATFFWNTEGNDFGEEEMSRFLKQLIHEFPAEVKERVLAHQTTPAPHKPITMPRNEETERRLSRYYTEGDEKGISPSALYTFLECRLKFYFRYIARMFESEEVEEDLDARTLGSVLHYLMEDLYTLHLRKSGKRVEARHLVAMKKRLPQMIEQAFRKHYGIEESQPFAIEGKNLIAREVVLGFAEKILDKDADSVPFEILGNEEKISLCHVLPNGKKVRINGTIDRIDRTRSGIRIIDYKTGKDKRNFESVEGIFSHDKPEKLPFQLFFYTELYDRVHPGTDVLIPSVFNKEVLFQGADHRLEMGTRHTKKPVVDYRRWQATFKKGLNELLEEVFFSDTDFDQTEDVNRCRYCPYNVICRRT